MWIPTSRSGSHVKALRLKELWTGPRVRLAILPLALAACQSQESRRVNEVLAFATAAPFTLAPTDGEFHQYATIAVSDSVVDRYNRIFGHFRVEDSLRSRRYRELPGSLFWGLPITQVIHTSEEWRGDTVVVVAIVQRPAHELFDESFSGLGFGESAPPIDKARADFTSMLLRVKRELSVTDTAWFYLTGSLIERWETASARREKARYEAAAAAAREAAQRVLDSARLSSFEVSDYSGAPAELRAVGGGGGAVKGIVDFRSVSPDTTKFGFPAYGRFEIHCQGLSASGDTTGVYAYLTLADIASRSREEFLCFWMGDAAREWRRVRPREFRVRIVAFVGTDSVLPPWTTVPSSASQGSRIR